MKNSAITLAGLVVLGNAVFLGSTTYSGSTVVTTTEAIFVVGSGATGGSAITVFSGLAVDRGGATMAAILWDESLRQWFVNDGSGLHQIQLVGAAGTIHEDNEEHTFGTTSVTLYLNRVPNPTTSLHLYLNGQRLKSGAGNDFTLANSLVTMLLATCTSRDRVLADYRY